MRFYIAARAAKEAEQKRVQKLIKALEHMGHTVPFDWTTMVVRKPYRRYPKNNQSIARAMVRAITECDAFVLLTSENLLGAERETGIAMAASTLIRKKKIYLVGAERQSIFDCLPGVSWFDTDEALLAELS